MPIKELVKVRSIKPGTIKVIEQAFCDVATADFVGKLPATFSVKNDAVKTIYVTHRGLDIKGINKRRIGPKKPEFEATSAEVIGATR